MINFSRHSLSFKIFSIFSFFLIGAENVLTKTFLNFLVPFECYNSKLREYKVNYLDSISDFVSPDDLDCVEVILKQL